MLDEQSNTVPYTGPIPGITNRRRFDERFSDLLSISHRVHCEMSLLMIDIDYYNQFIERYGQAAGDECLHKVGGCIAKSFARNTDCAARYGDVGFAVVSLASNIEDLRDHAQRLCEQVCALNIPHGDSPHGVITVTIGGIHRLPVRGTTEEGFLELASQQMLAARHHGGNCVRITG